MQGIMLRELGHSVRILEQYPTSVREGQAAGMSIGGHGQKFLNKYDRIQNHPQFVSASTLQITDINLRVTETRNVPFKLTNWKTLYYRLRANFDGLASEYVPTPPENLPTDGKVVYDVGKRVTGISYEKSSGIALTFEDVEQGDFQIIHPDLVIAADGANSTIRKLMFPNLDVPYAGFFTWRGVIRETDVSEDTRALLEDKCIRYRTDGGYIVAYALTSSLLP
jgi:2-polyprenyl-6-methoxyphenol hydroxylase-like FAD-dependent oxidoreductase